MSDVSLSSTLYNNQPKMPGKNKKFDKKGAYRFSLVHRSQLDPEYDNPNASKYVLQQIGGPEVSSSSDAALAEALQENEGTEGHAGEGEGGLALPSEAMFKLGNRDRFGKQAQLELDADELFERAQDQVDEFGFRDDGYDYSQHLREMGAGTFVGADGTVRSSNEGDLLAQRRREEEDEKAAAAAEAAAAAGGASAGKKGLTIPGKEKSKAEVAKSIALSTELMDADIAAALDGDWAVVDNTDAALEVGGCASVSLCLCVSVYLSLCVS